MKKYNIKGQKDTQKKKKRKMADVDCKGEKVPAFLSVRKILKKWLNLIQFCCVWILALSHQAPCENLQFLGYWDELFDSFLKDVFDKFLYSLGISFQTLTPICQKGLSFCFKPWVLITKEMWHWWVISMCMDVWSSCKKFPDVRRYTVNMNIKH